MTNYGKNVGNCGENDGQLWGTMGYCGGSWEFVEGRAGSWEIVEAWEIVEDRGGLEIWRIGEAEN